MVLSVLIDNDGRCSEVELKQSKHQITYNRKKTYVHYYNEKEHLMLLSTFPKEYVIKEDAELFDFGLPPPLNSFLYPKPLIIVSGTEKKIESLPIHVFIENCAKFNATVQELQESIAVYDIPLDNELYEEESEEESEEEYENYDDEDDGVEDDEEWEDDEDEGPLEK